MPSSVNVFYSNFRLGTNVTIQRRLMDVTFEWVDKDGKAHNKTRTITFPDDLALIPANILKDELTDLMLRMMRRAEGVDE